MPMSDNNDTENNQGADSAEANSAQVLAKINAIDVSNSLSAPLKQGIDDILKMAGESVGSADASVLIRDGNEGGLRFLVVTRRPFPEFATTISVMVEHGAHTLRQNL